MRGLGSIAAIVAAALLVGASGGAAARSRPRGCLHRLRLRRRAPRPRRRHSQAWSASPYRAVGIYLGGANRHAADGNLSASWVATDAVARLEPAAALRRAAGAVRRPDPAAEALDRARRRPRARTCRRRRRSGASRARSVFPRAARSTSTWRATVGNDARARRPSSRSSTAGTTELRAHRVRAGRLRQRRVDDPRRLGARPVDAGHRWIANWNGVEGVFGDPYVSDAIWPNHQRVHQYKGGHNETYGGVTINIDSNFVDGAVVGSVAARRRRRRLNRPPGRSVRVTARRPPPGRPVRSPRRRS